MPSPRQYQRTTYAVWEITLKCNLGCATCGSRAGESRRDELTTSEALDLVRQLAEAGVREVTLIGGEAYLRPDWLEIAAAIRAHGMACTMTTGGLGISAHLAKRMAEAGLNSVSVSIDGLEFTHDRQRGVPGSWRSAFAALKHMREAGLSVSVNTQLNAETVPELRELYPLIKDAGIHAWQVQMTVPMGRAADHDHLLLQPYELLTLFPILAELSERALGDGITMMPGNNVGYYGPYDAILRGKGQPGTHWMGCQAGVSTLGIEADGVIKGCPSLPTTPYTGGNVRDLSLAEIIAHSDALNFNRVIKQSPERATEELWGYCATCYYADLCRGGCSWTAHVFFGRRGNNPYCHHRALEFAAQGLQERLVRVQSAPGLPFDHGLFEIVEEPLTRNAVTAG